MATKRTYETARRGVRMTRGKGWRLWNVPGNKRFTASLVAVINQGDRRLAIFSVPKHEKEA